METLHPDTQPTQPTQPLPQTPAQERTDWKRFILDLFETVGLAVILFLVINTLSARVRVDGFSMLPTLQDGEFVLVNKLAYRLGSPARGDIIVFRSTTVADLDLVKRVIGLPGDHLTSRGNTIYVNGAPLKETWTHTEPLGPAIGNVTVPPNSYFMMGDNHADSCDSRTWGFVPRSDLIGKAFFRIWPPSRIGFL